MKDGEKSKEQLVSEVIELRKKVTELEKAKDQYINENGEALQKREHYYRSLIDNIHENIVVIDRDYLITDVNRTFLVSYGRKREEVIGRHCYEISHGYNEPCEEHGEDCKLRKVFKTGKAHTCTHQHMHVDGWKTWVDILVSPFKDNKGETTHVIEAVRDVSDLIKTGKSLRESEDKYSHLVESTLDWVWSIDIEGRITFTNRAVKYLLGYDVDEIVGSSSFSLMYSSDQEHFQKLYNRSVEQKKGWKNSVIRWCHKDGTVLFFESSAQPIIDSEGNLVGFIGIDRDITKREKDITPLEKV